MGIYFISPAFLSRGCIAVTFTIINNNENKQVTISKQEKIGISFNCDISTMHSPNPLMILDLPPKI